MTPLVSVIIPVYNVFPYLREALDSVINQTYRNLEIIIVDDGSTDGCASVCDEYKSDPRVKVIHQENRGLSGARNIGLDCMTGNYVAFLDSDDAFCTEMIETMIKAIVQHQADLVTCGFDIIETDGKLTEAVRTEHIIPEDEMVPTFGEVYDSWLNGRFIVSAWNKLYTAEIWKNLRYPEGYVYEDLRIIPYILERSRCIAVVPKALVLYRRRKGSITQTGSIQNVQDFIDAYQLRQEYIEKIQPAFPNGSILRLKENTLRLFILHWADLRRQKVSKDVLDILKKEITERSEQIDRLYQMKSKVTWLLFRFCPSMILPVQVCYHRLKAILGKERRIIA